MFKEEYEELLNKRNETINEIKKLENDKKVKRYLKLKATIERLDYRKPKLYKNMKIEEYDKCNHLLISDNNNFYCYCM